MIKSMTGFGRCNMVIGDKDITVEIKSVNHRFFEYSSRLPRTCLYMDDKLKARVGESIMRGKVELFLTVINSGDSGVSVTADIPLVHGYMKAFNEISRETGLENNISLSGLVRFSDIFNVKKVQDDEEQALFSVLTVLDGALVMMLQMRTREGENLKADVSENLKNISSIVERIEELTPEAEIKYKERLLTKLNAVLEDTQIDQQRIITEAAIFAEKTAIAEELVRLNSHISQFLDMLESDGPIGKKLDFLTQEINREINTIGSKANNLDITKLVLEAKSYTEMVREQIQNIE